MKKEFITVRQLIDVMAQAKARMQEICKQTLGACTVHKVEFLDNGTEVETEIEIHTLGATVFLKCNSEVLDESDIAKAVLLFQLTDNIQRASTFNGIIKGERLLIGVVDSNYTCVSDFPQSLITMLGIKSIEFDKPSQVALINLSSTVPMIVGSILTSEGKQDQYDTINQIKGKVTKSIHGNKTRFYIEPTNVL